MSIKNLLRVSALSAICLFATGCSDDDGYNADSAISNYVPEEYSKMVESVTTVIEDDGGREYMWTYEFLYDIKKVSCATVHLLRNIATTRLCSL